MQQSAEPVLLVQASAGKASKRTHWPGIMNLKGVARTTLSVISDGARQA